MNLVLDIGNTNAKVGVFDRSSLIFSATIDDIGAIGPLLDKYTITKVCVSSVKGQESVPQLTSNLPTILLDASTPLPFTNCYKTPQTLGTDRLAAVAGALKYFPGRNILVIDFGTSITFDLLTDQGDYLGGGISLGIDMRFKALDTFTNALPLVSRAQAAPLIGQTTEECIRSGVQNGVLAEVNGIVASYRNKFEQLKVVICGGDTHFFETNIKGDIFAASQIVLDGLNEILEYNVP